MNNTIELLKFSAKWCQPCTAYAPVITKWIEGKEGVQLTNVDVEVSPDMGAKYRIMSVPTTILLVNGTEAKRYSGPMNEGELDNFIKV